MPTVDFSQEPDLFTQVFHDYREIDTRFGCIYGGSGSSKSYSVHQSELIDLLTSTETDGAVLIMRKTRASLVGSSFRLMELIAKSWGIYHMFRWWKSTSRMEIEGPKGGKIFFHGLDNVDNLMSFAGVRKVIVEEAHQAAWHDWKELNRRARGFPKIQLFLIFNPIDGKHWINEWLFVHEIAYKPKTTFLKYTYHVNLKNMTDDEVEELENLKYIDPVDYDIFVLAQWGSRSAEYPYALNYDDQKHCTEGARFIPGLPVIALLDFNMRPFVCELCHIWTDEAGPHFWTFDEIVLENGSVPEMIDQIRTRVPADELHMLEVSGDATSRKGDINRRDNASSWQMIKDDLNITRSRFKVPRSNPNPRNNRTLLNAVLLYHPDVRISAECKLLRRDLRGCEVAPDGGILKKNRANELQQADALDAWRYGIAVYFANFMKEWKKYKKAA